MAAPHDLRPPRHRGRGRRPAAEVRHGILSAARELLVESGLNNVTFEKVAARSGASRTTIYKWWPSPRVLAFEAYFTPVEQVAAFADTGDIARDLRSQLKAFVELLTDPTGGPVIAELIGAAQSDSALMDGLIEAHVKPRRELAVDRLRRAQADGQIRADIDLQVCIDQLWGACYNRLLLPAAAIDERFADALVENLVTGLAP